MRVLLVALLFVAAALALSPDLLATQWRHEHLGRICDACSLTDGLIIWGEGNVAALDNNGRIRWRRSASCPIAHGNGCTTLHLDEGRISQSTHGTADWAVPEQRTVTGAVPLYENSVGWVLHNGRELWALSARSGNELWRSSSLQEGEQIESLIAASPTLIVVRKLASLLTAAVDSKTGTLSSRNSHAFEAASSPVRSIAVMGSAVLLALDTDGTLYHAPLSSTSPMQQLADNSLTGSDVRLIASPLWSEAALLSVSASSSRIQRLSLSSSRTSISISPAQDGFASVSAESALVFAASSNTSFWFDLRSASAPAVSVSGPNSILPVRSMLALRASAPVLLVQRADLRLDQFTADLSASAPRLRRSWIRDEALAHVVDALFADLAAPPHSNLLDLFGASVVSEHKREEAKGLKQEEYRDRYGLRKQALLLTDVHSLHSLATEGGGQLWRTSLPPAPLSTALWSHVFESRKSASIVVIITQEHVTTLVAVAPYTGAITSQETLQGAALHAAVHKGLVYVVDAQGNAFAWPRTSPSLLSNVASHLFFVLNDETTVRGYALKEQVDGAWKAEERWVYRAAAGERVVRVELSDEGDLSASGVKIRSNGSVLHKSHLLPSSALLLLYNATTSSLVCVLLHAPTGAALHTGVYRGAAGPISTMKAEHWYAVLFWDTRAHRQAVHVTELFSRPDPTLSQHPPLAWFFAWAFGGIDPSQSPTAKDVRPDALYVMSQSYYLMPGSFSTLRALGVTHTHSGIAGKLMLLASATGQLLGIEKRLLDVRRVPREKWTQFEQEDGILPYNASVYIPPRAALFAKPVASLRFVRSTAARLESTTHVLAVGTDLMYTHACPAGPFDRLSPDFNRFALVATLAGLTAVTVILVLMKRTPPPK